MIPWTAPVAGSPTGVDVGWHVAPDSLRCTRDGDATVCRSNFVDRGLGRSEAPNTTWLLVWLDSRGAPDYAIPAPQSPWTRVPARFSVASVDLDRDGREELVIASYAATTSGVTPSWNVAIVPRRPGGKASRAHSPRFDPSEFGLTSANGMSADLVTWRSPVAQFFERAGERCVFHERIWRFDRGTANGITSGERRLYSYRDGLLETEPMRVVVDHPREGR